MAQVRSSSRSRPSPAAPSGPVVLLTGFDPFDGAGRNPSGEIALALDGAAVAGARVHGRLLPTAYEPSVEAALEAIRGLNPDIVLMLGVADGRTAVTVERVGINLDDSPVVDNQGERRTERPIRPDGPAACFATLPVRKMADAIAAAGVDGAVSTTAGAFVCNHLFYSVLAALEGSAVRAGFVHVPALEGTVAAEVPTMPLDDMIAAVEAALAAAVEG